MNYPVDLNGQHPVTDETKRALLEGQKLGQYDPELNGLRVSGLDIQIVRVGRHHIRVEFLQKGMPVWYIERYLAPNDTLRLESTKEAKIGWTTLLQIL